MKATLAVFSALSLAACNKHEVVLAPPPATPLPIATPAPTPTPTPVAVRSTTPSPTPVAIATPPPATPARRLAAEGVFYLVSWVRIETNDGIVGLPPGTGVKLVRPGVYLTPAGEAPLNDYQITNDLDIARRARDAGLAGQAAVNQRQTEEERKAAALAAGAEREGTATHNAQLDEIERKKLNAKLADLKRKRATIDAQESVLTEDADKIISKRGADANSADRASVRAQLNAVEQEILDTQAALNKLE
jgi:hypothetical protein